MKEGALLGALVVCLLVSTIPLVLSGGGTPSAPRAPAATASVRIAPAFVPLPGTVTLGPVSAGTELTVLVGLASQDPSGLAAAARSAPTPFPAGSHGLADKFGSAPADYLRAVQYFQSFGLRTTESPDRLVLLVQGPAPRMALAFHTSFEQYRADGRTFYSHPSAASLPSGIPWTGAVGLGTERGPVPLSLGLPSRSIPALRPAAGCASAVAVTPCDYTIAYNASTLFGAGTDGSGYRIGIVDTYDSSETQNALAQDLLSFTQNFSLPSGNVNFLYPIPTTKNLNATSTGWGVEEALDLEWARGTAPGAAIDMTFAPDAFAGLYGAVDWLVAHHAVDVISLSWGEPDVGVFNAYAGPCSFACNATSDGSYTLLGPVLEAAAAEGIGVFAASGDCGAAGGTSGVSTGYPASDPYVTGVGGTVLTVNSTGGYVSESAWSGNASGAKSPGCQNQGGSGGGFSPFPRPSWQRGTGVPTSPATRGEPDVALLGGTAVTIYYQGSQAAVEGTSAATPMWAGLEAVADQYAGRALGSLNPALYRIAGTTPAAFHDVTSGSNGYSAGTGWDPVTGLGSPNIGRLVPLLTASALTTPMRASLAATPRFGSTPLSVSFSVNATGGKAPYGLYDVSFGDGNSSIAPGGNVSHTYPGSGAYIASAVVFDASGNSTTTAPVVIVAGGGKALNVTLNASPVSSSVGANVTFTATVSGGTGPYGFTYYFGDGTYLAASGSSSAVHAYSVAGGFCATVAVTDAATPMDGGSSLPVALSVGGAPSACGAPAPLTASLAVSPLAADVPGNLQLSVNTSGGAPPVTQWINYGDSYATACQCGLFHTPGNYTVRAYVNDSASQQVVAMANVTLYPALTGTFTASVQSGPAPLTVNFTALASGGFGNRSYRWSFGDGGNGFSPRVNHTYSAPGAYVAIGRVFDRAGGNASEAFLLDVLPANATGLVLTATVTPAVYSLAGVPVRFAAAVTGGSAPYVVRWELGQNDSAFGTSVQQTYSAFGCLAAGTCPLTIGLSAVDALGRAVSTNLSLSPFLAGRYGALTLTDTLGASYGTTPFSLSASATAAGMPGATVLWSFGDSPTTSNGTTATHTYLFPGNYTVTELARDPAGDALVRTHAIVVNGSAIPRPSVVGGPSLFSGFAPLTVGFSVNGSGGGGPPYTYNWSFGDGGTATGSAATHTYGIPGSFVALVTVTDRLGLEGNASYPISVYRVTPVTLSAALSPTSAPTASEVTLLVTGSAGCTSESAPGCAIGNVTLLLSWVPVGFAAGTPALPLLVPPASGTVTAQLPTPTVAGDYTLTIVVGTPGYSGSATVPFSTTGPIFTTPYFIFAVAGAVGLVAAVAIVLVVLRRRRGPEPVSP